MARKNNTNNTNNTVIISNLPTINPTVFDITAIRNERLAEKVSLIQGEMVKANQNASKSMLKVATYYYDIVANELFSEDFTSKDAFAKFMGIAPSSLSNMVNAVDFVKSHKNDFKANQLSVAKACILRTAEKNECLDAMVSWLKDNNILLENISDAQMKKVWSDFKETHPALIAPSKKGKVGKGKGKDNADSADSADSADTAPDVIAKDTTLEGGRKSVTIQYNGMVFSVPAKAWKAFMKENNG